MFEKIAFALPDKSDPRYSLAMADYVTCRILSVMVILLILVCIYKVIFKKPGREAVLSVVKYGLFYLPVIITALAIKLPGGFVTNDEYSILNDAVNVIHDTWFNFMTVYFYIISLMLIPVKCGPIIVKAAIEFIVVGYSVYRAKGYYGRAGFFTYALFLLYPFIAYTTSAHRLPVYFLIYLAIIVKLLFDRLEKKDITFAGGAFLLFFGAVLTQWRTEGIYLLALIPILMLLVYPRLRKLKYILLILVSYVAIQAVLYIPQNGAFAGNLSGAANDRMKPFWAYTITNMYRNGLDLDKNAADLAIVDKYLSLDVIRDINEHYGDINYEDVLILYRDGFVGVREEAGDKEFYDYSEALKRIFKNNPDVFLRTRWGAFCYAALPFRFSLGLSAVKSVAYNLFIPTVFAMLLCLYSLIKRRWFSFFVSGGLICHWFIVFILAPASYFKYYFPVYITSYLFIILLVIWGIWGRREHKSSPVV